MRRNAWSSRLALLLALALATASGHPADFRVTPIRLDFDQKVRTGALTVINESKDKLQVQMTARTWTQDADGKDQYQDTTDIVFFPRILMLTSNQEGVIRAGVKAPPPPQEKTYRLFVQEIPEQRPRTTSAVAIAVQFAIPFFVKPLREQPKAEWGGVGVSQGRLQFSVRNTGNIHFRIETAAVTGVDGKGVTRFTRALSGWYVLAGARRGFQSDFSDAECRATRRIEIKVQTDPQPLSLSTKIDLDPHVCDRPPLPRKG